MSACSQSLTETGQIEAIPHRCWVPLGRCSASVSRQVHRGVAVYPETWAVWWYHDHTVFQLELWMMSPQQNSVWVQYNWSFVMVDCSCCFSCSVIGCAVDLKMITKRFEPFHVFWKFSPQETVFPAFMDDDHRLLFNLHLTLRGCAVIFLGKQEKDNFCCIK